MPVRDRRPEDDRPLFRAVNEHRLIGPVGEEEQHHQAEGAQAGAQSSPQAEPDQGEKGPIARAVDRAQENNWVYPSMANKARETGLLDKVDEVVSRLTGK